MIKKMYYFQIHRFIRKQHSSSINISKRKIRLASFLCLEQKLFGCRFAGKYRSQIFNLSNQIWAKIYQFQIHQFIEKQHSANINIPKRKILLASFLCLERKICGCRFAEKYKSQGFDRSNTYGQKCISFRFTELLNYSILQK